MNPPVPPEQRHDCGDPACDGEALTIALKACAHSEVIYLRPLDPFHRTILVGNVKFYEAAWCVVCGAIGEREGGEMAWHGPRWFDAWKGST